jgi:dTDP-4-amino-4,6-dideoxygalactose transaminase
VFSFHATKTINSGEGGCVTTNDDDLAARMRNIRSSYGSGLPVDVPITTNGRFSEAQAALGRLSLHRFQENIEKNERLWERYSQGLNSVPGFAVLPPTTVDESNWQTLSCVIDPAGFGLERDHLLSILKAEQINARRYFYPGCHRSPPYRDSLPEYRDALPNTDSLCDTVMQLPLGAQVDRADVDQIVTLIEMVQRNSDEIAHRISS